MTSAEDETTRSEEPQASPAPRRRRLLSLLLLVGGAGAAMALLPKLPREHEVNFRIEEDPASVVGFDVTWTPLEHGQRAAMAGADATAGSAFHFEPGHAPKIIHTTVSLPPGSYALDITLERADRRESIQRTLTLDAGEQITVPLR
jgi:hypothetical protein